MERHNTLFRIIKIFTCLSPLCKHGVYSAYEQIQLCLVPKDLHFSQFVCGHSVGAFSWKQSDEIVAFYVKRFTVVYEM